MADIDASTITYSNPTYSDDSNQRIDVVIVHPEHGSIPFTADSNDPVAFGSSLYARIIADGVSISPYVAPSDDDV